MSERNLSQMEKDDAKRLKELWNKKKEILRLSQVTAAKQLGYNSQGAISQYINGKVGLNFHAAAKFAKLLRVEIKEISPRFGSLVTKPLPTSLDGYSAPQLGYLNGFPTDSVLDWFAYGQTFCNAMGAPAEHMKLVRMDDSTFKEMPPGTIALVDDREQKTACDGVYLLQDADKIIVRRLTITGNEVVISSGQGKKQHLTTDVFGLLKILAVVRFVITPVA